MIKRPLANYYGRIEELRPFDGLPSFDIDPTQFSAWLPIKHQVFNVENLMFVADNLDGDSDEIYKVIVGCKSADREIRLYFNDDNDASNYTQLYHRSGSAHSSGVSNGILPYLYNTSNGYTEAIIYARAFQPRTMVVKHVDITNNKVWYDAYIWNNQVDVINKITIYSKGTLEDYVDYADVALYKMNDIRALTMYSKELFEIKTGGNAQIDLDIPVENSPNIKSFIIEYEIVSGSTSNDVTLTLNNNTSNYTTSKLLQDGSSVQANSVSSQSNFNIVSFNDNYDRVIGFLKVSNSHNKLKLFEGRNDLNLVNNIDKNIEILGGMWGNSSEDISSIQIKSSGNVEEYKITIWKETTAHLVALDTGVINGLWIDYVNEDAVKVAAGNIEIFGNLIYIDRPTEVVLSHNIIDTEQPDCWIYLYAVWQPNRVLDFKFSLTQANVDRYGNVVDFDFARDKTPLFHPQMGPKYRYIGRVWNDSSSNIDSTKIEDFYRFS